MATLTRALLTLTEAQEVLGIKKTKMYELINGGEIKTVDVSAGEPKQARRVGDKGPRPSRRIEWAEIERYIERNRVFEHIDARLVRVERPAP
jgi:hypothetical protein